MRQDSAMTRQQLAATVMMSAPSGRDEFILGSMRDSRAASRRASVVSSVSRSQSLRSQIPRSQSLRSCSTSFRASSRRPHEYAASSEEEHCLKGAKWEGPSSQKRRGSSGGTVLNQHSTARASVAAVATPVAGGGQPLEVKAAAASVIQAHWKATVMGRRSAAWRERARGFSRARCYTAVL